MRRSGEQIRISTTIEIVKGMLSPEVKRKQYNQLKTFGVGRDISLSDWQDYLLQMLQLGLFEIVYDEGKRTQITPLGEEVLFGRKEVLLNVVDHSTKEQGRQRRSRLQLQIPTIPIPGLPPTSGTEDKQLFEALRQLRMQCAEQEKMPPYIVFSDKVLHSLATIKPTTLEAFGHISGIGEFKKQKYGLRFTALICKFVQE